ADVRWEYENLPYWGGEVDVCINSWALSNGLWLDADVDGLVDWLLEHQQDDGGWNCEWIDGSRVSSFHSTLNALLGLLDYQIRTGDAARVAKARCGGEEYLLARDLFRRRSSGEPFDDRVFVLFPPSAVVLRCPPCGRLLPARGARRRGGPRPAHDRRDREHPQRTRGRRIVAAGPSPRWRRAVPRRCSARSAVETGDIPRLQNPRMVGRSTSVPALLSGNLGTPQSRARPRRHDGVIT